MSTWNKIMECVPNFSEGRDLEKIDKIVAPFRAKTGVKLLDYSNDEDHKPLGCYRGRGASRFKTSRIGGHWSCC